MQVRLTPKKYGAWNSAEERKAWFDAVEAENAEKEAAAKAASEDTEISAENRNLSQDW